MAADADKYAVSYPATAQGDITPRGVTVTVTLSGNEFAAPPPPAVTLQATVPSPVPPEVFRLVILSP